MTINIEQIKRNYAGFEDFKIIHIAKNEARGLEPEVIPILIDEINKRGLDWDLIKGIEAQTKELSTNEIIELKNKIIHLPCPECGQKDKPLIGTLIRKVKSYVLLTSTQKAYLISCKSCAEKERKNAMITTALLGWRGIPMGLVKTPIALIASLRDKKRREEISEVILTNFAISNVGEIKTN
ncbi:MAG: hypothetical protein HC831_00950 [Chloroflexia bacterium]|nr:hypothetical protein [Chloroflexia bacterium]